MTDQPKRLGFATDGIAAPLRHPVFRRIWLASLVSNLGILIQGVGARFQQQFDRAWRPGEQRRGRIVVIGQKGLDRAAIARSIAGE